jgi:hypothetical protein
MSESSAGEVVESLGTTCTIPGATTISSELTGGVATPATIPGGASPRSVVSEDGTFWASQACQKAIDWASSSCTSRCRRRF